MVFKSQGFNELSDDALAFILQSDRLKMDEEEILEKVTEWATVNSVSWKVEQRPKGGEKGMIKNIYSSSSPFLLYVGCIHCAQVVTGQEIAEAAAKVICHIRFALLDPDKLSQVERDNDQKKFIPVSDTCLCILKYLT